MVAASFQPSISGAPRAKVSGVACAIHNYYYYYYMKVRVYLPYSRTVNLFCSRTVPVIDLIPTVYTVLIV